MFASKKKGTPAVSVSAEEDGKSPELEALLRGGKGTGGGDLRRGEERQVSALWEAEFVTFEMSTSTNPPHWRYRNHTYETTAAFRLVEWADEFVLLQQIGGPVLARAEKAHLYFSSDPKEQWATTGAGWRVRWAGRTFEGKWLNEDRTAWSSLSSTISLNDEGALVWKEVVGNGAVHYFDEISRGDTHVIAKDLSRNITVRAGPRYLEFATRSVQGARDSSSVGGSNGSGGDEELEWHIEKGGRWAEDGSGLMLQERLGKAPLSAWGPGLVCDLLRSLQLAKYVPAFGSARIDGPTLVQLTDEDLRVELGMSSRIHRCRLLGHVQRHVASPPPKAASIEPAQAQARPPPAPLESSSGDLVFLSYCWSNQETALRVRAALEAKGVRVWMDIAKMGGGDNLLEQIDRGIRAADVVVCCLSKAYSVSSCCTKEVLLAESLRKPMVCLLLEPPARIPFPPLGCLGPVFAGMLYVQVGEDDGSVSAAVVAVSRRLSAGATSHEGGESL